MEYSASNKKYQHQYNFNSIKVRLEFSAELGFIGDLTVFQFHKGAIGVTYQQRTGYRRFRFQFHKGAIGVPHHNSVQIRQFLISIP